MYIKKLSLPYVHINYVNDVIKNGMFMKYVPWIVVTPTDGQNYLYFLPKYYVQETKIIVPY